MAMRTRDSLYIRCYRHHLERPQHRHALHRRYLTLVGRERCSNWLWRGFVRNEGHRLGLNCRNRHRSNRFVRIEWHNEIYLVHFDGVIRFDVKSNETICSSMNLQFQLEIVQIQTMPRYDIEIRDRRDEELSVPSCPAKKPRRPVPSSIPHKFFFCPVLSCVPQE